MNEPERSLDLPREELHRRILSPVLILVHAQESQPSCSRVVTKLSDDLPVGTLVLLFAREVVDSRRLLSAGVNFWILFSLPVSLVEQEELVRGPKVFRGGRVQ